jgi:Domain of unknown function (DUF1707)
MAATARDRGQLRASHADREQVIRTLKAAFVQGMLAKDEFDLRVGQTLASRTYAELSAVTADLPAGLTTAESPRRARSQDVQPVLPPGPAIEAATALYAGAWAYILLLSPNGGDNPATIPLIFSTTLVYLGVLIICVGAMLINRRDKRSGGQPPRQPGVRGPASRRLPSADPGRQFPPADPRRWHTAEAVPTRHAHPLQPVRGHCPGSPPAAGTAPASA